MTRSGAPKLGRLEPVPLRDIWPHEALDFTPWLLANPDIMGEVLQMDLELEQAEHPVGDYWLDLIGRNTATDELVIVENQLGSSDHSHLGQLLTYASGTDAVNVVWVTSRFREEHRATLDWLNSRTDDRTRFFGIEVSAVRIGESDPAPLLRLVAEPNDWNKIVKAAAASPSGGERAALYMEFWTLYFSKLHQDFPSWTRSNRATHLNWITLASGTTNVSFGTNFSQRGLCSEIYFSDPSSEVNVDRFEKLRTRQSEFEAVAGQGVEWQRLDGKKACRVALYRPDSSIFDRDEWTNYVDWFLETQDRLRRAWLAVGK